MAKVVPRPSMQPDPTIRALAACGNTVLRAPNGHHKRWAVERCTKALVAAGTSPAIAQRSAEAMRAVADRLREQQGPTVAAIAATLTADLSRPA